MAEKQDYQVKTMRGYDFFEVSSSFQKAIRRCDEEQAMYWALELFHSNYHNYLWKRMLIMVSEDVGLAEPMAPAIMAGLHHNHEVLVKAAAGKKPIDKLPTMHAVLYLVRCKKSRVVDWALGFYSSTRHIDAQLEIPDYALDKHTRRGKAMGRTIVHFFEEGAALENHDIQRLEKEYMEGCQEYWTKEVHRQAIKNGQSAERNSPKNTTVQSQQSLNFGNE